MEEIREKIEALRGARVLVVGDLFLDESLIGQCARLAAEGTAPVLSAASRSYAPGGAAAVSQYLAQLGAEVQLCSVTGRPRAEGPDVVSLLAPAIRRAGVVLHPHGSQPCKSRIYGCVPDGLSQLLARVDTDLPSPLPPALDEQLRSAVLGCLDWAEAIVVADRGKGGCSIALLAQLLAEARRRQLPVLVDPAPGVADQRYKGATVVKLNRQELHALTAKSPGPLPSDEAAGKRVRHLLGTDWLLVTRAADSAVIVTPMGLSERVATWELPVLRTLGAGDRYLAVLAVAWARGWEPALAARLGQVAAALHCASWSPREITLDHLTWELEDAGEVSCKLPAAATAPLMLADWRRRGLSIVLACGCFDLLHAGHLTLLMHAARAGDRLIVACNTDASVGQLKGPGRPCLPWARRARMLAELQSVDLVLPMEGPTAAAMLRQVRPSVLAVGGRTGDLPPEEMEQLTQWGGQLLRAPLLPGVSTSALRSRKAEEVALTPGQAGQA
jgi:D-beta-D-heptose 7-phosphate kinase/D-beta-D-heptose 1-phosphate adenosyltransferase